jgi:hypothetical protein
LWLLELACEFAQAQGKSESLGSSRRCDSNVVVDEAVEGGGVLFAVEGGGAMASKQSIEANGRVQEQGKRGRWILVTGGAGYIGSHTVLQLLTEGYFVVIIDNLVNSCEEAVHRVRKLAGELGENLKFFEVCSDGRFFACFLRKI